MRSKLLFAALLELKLFIATVFVLLYSAEPLKSSFISYYAEVFEFFFVWLGYWHLG